MGGGIGMGNTCKPMAVSFQCMTKFTTKKKKKKKEQEEGVGKEEEGEEEDKEEGFCPALVSISQSYPLCLQIIPT